VGYIQHAVSYLFRQLDHRRLLNAKLKHQENDHASKGGANQFQALCYQANADKEKHVEGGSVTVARRLI